jgi:cytochrome c
MVAARPVVSAIFTSAHHPRHGLIPQCPLTLLAVACHSNVRGSQAAQDACASTGGETAFGADRHEQEKAMRIGVKEKTTVRLLRTGALALVAVVASTAAGLAQDAAAGEQVFRRMCSPCHDIGEDAKVKLGPPLNAVDGRTAGTFEGFNYSQANKSSGITWNQESFTKYIRAPMQEMPGTRMAFVGIKNDNDIANLWAYLKQFKANGSK